MTPSFLFVESNTTGTGAIAVDRLLEQGAKVIFLARQPEKYPFLATGRTGLSVRAVETNDLEAVSRQVADLRRAGGLEALLTFSEFYVATVAELARRFGFRYLSPESARVCRDKFQTRTTLRAAGLPTPAFWRVASAEEAHAVASRVSYPCIVKPPSDSSSKGVRLVQAPRELLEHFHRLHGWRVNDRGQRLTGEVLIESLLVGPEVSVETVTFAPGHTELVGITAKHLSPPPVFVEVGHDFPAALAPSLARRIEAQVRSALDAVGFDFGPAHTEVRLTADGPVIVEINPRLAGGMIPELVRYALGIDLLSAFLDQLRGLPVDLTPVRKEWASIRFLLASHKGRLAWIEGIETARGLPLMREASLLKRQGAVLRPAEEAADRVGFVIASGPSREGVLAAADQAVEQVRLEIDPAAFDASENPSHGHSFKEREWLDDRSSRP